MRSINLVLVSVASALCLLVGAFLNSWILLGLSVVLALGAYVLNQRLEQRRMSQDYREKPRSQETSSEQQKEINAPDFFQLNDIDG